MPAIDGDRRPAGLQDTAQLCVGKLMLSKRQVMDGVHRYGAVKGIGGEGQTGNVRDHVQTALPKPQTGLPQGRQGDIGADAVIIILGVGQIFRPLYGTRSGIQEEMPARGKMPADAQVAVMNVIAGDGPQVLVAGVLVEAIANLAPANAVVKLADLLLGVLHHSFSRGTIGGGKDYCHTGGLPDRLTILWVPRPGSGRSGRTNSRPLPKARGPAAKSPGPSKSA